MDDSKPLVWLEGEIRTPPFSQDARLRAGLHWRIVYHLAEDAIVILDVFAKKSRRTPKRIIDACRRRLARYRDLTGES